MAAQIQGANELKARLRRAGPSVLHALTAPIFREAADISIAALGSVPTDEGELAASAFVAPPEVNEKRMSVTGTVGYEAEHAAYVHEGYHYGRKVATPPKWFERAASGREQRFAQDIGDAIRSELARLGK